jgi:hypothetical protein
VAAGLENHFGGKGDGGRRLPASVRQFTDSPALSPALRSPASNAIKHPMQSPHVLLCGDICGHTRCRAGGYCRKALVAGGDPLSLRRSLGTVTEPCRLHYRAEQIRSVRRTPWPTPEHPARNPAACPPTSWTQPIPLRAWHCAGCEFVVGSSPTLRLSGTTAGTDWGCLYELACNADSSP